MENKEKTRKKQGKKLPENTEKKIPPTPQLKYSEIDLCGMRFTRDIALENQGYEIELEHPITPLGRDVIPHPSSQPPSRRGSLNNV